MLFGFRAQLREVIGSAAEREVTLEIGGQTMSLGKLRMVDAVRVLDPAVPVAVYAGPRTTRTMNDAATAAGANLVTDSPWELSEFFRKLELR